MPITKLAFLGVGEHALYHLRERLPGVETVYYYDPNPNIKLNIEGIETIRCESEDTLYTESSDAPVIIMSPDRYHFQQMQRALSEKRFIYCEKPLLSDAQEIDGLKKLLASEGANITSCHPRRFDKAYADILKPMIEGQSALTTGLGRVTQLSIHFDYQSLNRSVHDAGMMIDKLNHDLDILRFIFDVKRIELTKKYDSSSAFRVEGTLETQNGISIELSFGGGCYGEKGFQEWIQVEFEQGYVLINPDKQIKDAKPPEGVTPPSDAEVVILNRKDQTLKYFKRDRMGTDHQARLDGVNRAVLAQFSGGPAYLSHSDLLFNNIIPAQLGYTKCADKAQQTIIDQTLSEIHKRTQLSTHLKQIIQLAQEGNYKNAHEAWVIYGDALSRDNAETVALLQHLKLHDERSTTYQEEDININVSTTASMAGMFAGKVREEVVESDIHAKAAAATLR